MLSYFWFIVILSAGSNFSCQGREPEIHLDENPPKSVTLTCMNLPYDETFVEWKKDGRLLPEEETHHRFSPDRRNLTIAPIKVRDSGTYSCGSLTLDRFSKPTYLTFIPAKPSVEPNSYNHIVGQNLSLTCDRVKAPFVEVTWSRKGTRLARKARFTFPTNRTLTIISLDKEDEGKYTCTASTKYGSMESDYFNLAIFYGPEGIGLQILSQYVNKNSTCYVKKGEKLQMKCAFHSRPWRQPVWKFQNKIFHRSSQSYGEWLVTNSAALNHSGQYTCFVKNEVTENNITMSVNVVVMVPCSKPSVQLRPAHVKEHKNMSLMCQHLKGTSAQYTWNKNGQRIIPSDRFIFLDRGHDLVILAVQRPDQGTYQCSAANAFGRATSDPVTVNVQYQSNIIWIVSVCVVLVVLMCAVVAAAYFKCWKSVEAADK
uniref:carcinoembryonic antigen-related cell adhesion molecule 1-like n=1 Tax=Myxine glutinosa TaxID=7769 RepID=UPI00358F8462